VLRAGLCALLNAEPGLEVVGEADNGEDAIQLAKQVAPDIILMDLSMPGIGGIEATRRITELQPSPRVLILTMHDDKGLLREAIRSGASGYILKRALKAELIHAIQVVMNGDLYVHPALTRALFTEIESSPTSVTFQVEVLSPREVEVLRLIAQGHTNSQIAQALSISVRTVEYHRGNLMGKLNARSRVELVRYAAEHGFLDNE
jgi:two-component system response regulator NreC